MALDPASRYNEATWTGGLVRAVDRGPAAGPYFGDFIEGSDATFVVGVAPGRYRVRLSLGDPRSPRGPMDVELNGRPLASGLTVPPGESRDVVGDTQPGTGRIAVRITAADCGAFAAAGLAVYRASGDPVPAGPVLRPLFPPGASGETQPVPWAHDGRARTEARTVLRGYCEFLLGRRPDEGCFAWSGNWYESAFPLRMLLAASAVLDDPGLADAAGDCLDRFVDEQHDDANWSSQYFGRRGCPVVPADAVSANLADVGTVSLCLALAASVSLEPRRSRYLRSAAAYADRMVLPHQLPSGAFPNLLYQGHEYTAPYSVATGVQASSLAGLFLATGDARYRDASVRAGLFLAAACRPDGKVVFYDYRRTANVAEDPFGLGDYFYVIEGMLWAAKVAGGPSADTLHAAVGRVLRGPRGVATWESNRAWWYPQKPWEESKRAGLLYLLELYQAGGPEDPRVRSLAGKLAAHFADPGYADRFGIGADPGSPRGRFALTATGMAGLGMIAFLEPERLFPGSPSQRSGGPR